ncbi:hypothetical protein J3Q64DRAFT_1638102 [Phycomyces blakesleeanus]|uniref:Chromatin modification-related protein n=1 Tax=Phycomyces blakesleeanus TaxID=4837 RepID=A0ABR3B2F2_PHYBL
MRELEGYAQELLDSTAKGAIDLIDNVKEMDPNERIDKLKILSGFLSETLKRGEEKVALAKSTFDTAEKNCNRLDADLVKFEDEQVLGMSRVTSQPGLAPSARSLKESADLRDKANKRSDRERKDGKSEKREKQSKTAMGTNKNGNGKAKTVVPADLSIDPNEPLYCYCQQVSYGEMVACDNTDCEIEWFHLACVDLKTVPKGKWYCNNCSTKMKGKHRK